MSTFLQGEAKRANVGSVEPLLIRVKWGIWLSLWHARIHACRPAIIDVEA